MSDVKLFRINGSTVKELEGHSVALEKSLQTLIERHARDRRERLPVHHRIQTGG